MGFGDLDWDSEVWIDNGWVSGLGFGVLDWDLDVWIDSG